MNDRNDRSMTTQIRILQRSYESFWSYTLYSKRCFIALKGRNSCNQCSCPRVKFPRLSWSPGKAASTTCRIIFKSGQATFSSTQTRWPWQVQHLVSTSGMDNKAFELSELIKDPKGQVSLFFHSSLNCEFNQSCLFFLSMGDSITMILFLTLLLRLCSTRYHWLHILKVKEPSNSTATLRITQKNIGILDIKSVLLFLF